MEKCWSSNPKDRPSFEEIFNKLAGIDMDENSYFLSDIDF